MPPAPPGETRDSAPHLVGRRRELSWLRSRLDLATRGYGHLVLVEGDAGIGKTRLVEEFLVGARSAGVGVVRGRSYEHLDLSYLPLREALFAPLALELSGRPGRERDVELLHRMGALGDLDLDDLPEGEAGDREHTRQMLALTRLVIEAARARPTAIFIDDVDWADRATLDLVRHLLFRMADEPVGLLVIGTSRSDPGARAAGGLSRLRSDPRVATLSLHPLSDLEATEFARQLEPSGSVEHARRLAGAGNGNPLLIEALAQESRRGESPDPLSSNGGGFGASHHPVTDAIATRLLTLDTAARTAARAAAFLQPGCTRDVLAAATGLDDAALDGALADAIAHGVLVDDPEHPRFTHPLFAHTLIEEMPGPARREFHAKIAALLAERHDAGEPVEAGAIAHHLIEAGDRADPAVVAEVARRAGDEAMVRTAWNEAARCYEAAIAACPIDEPSDRAALHRSAGLAHRGDMELGTAVKHFALAIDLLGPDADPVLLTELHVWRIRCGVGSQTVLGEARDRGALEALVERIVDIEPELAAEGLVELAESYWVDWEMGHAADNARRAMHLAEEIGSHRAFVRAVTSLSVPQWAEYDLLGSLETLEAGIAHARAARDDSVLVGGALFRAPLVLAWLGRLDEAEELALEGIAVAERTHYPLEEGLPLAALTQVAVARGRFAEAEQYAHQALLVQRLSGYHWAAGLYLPALATGLLAESRFDGAREALDVWAETGDVMEQAAIQLYRRLVATRERGQAVQGGRVPRAPATPMIGGDAWAAACVEIARWEGPTADIASARDLLAAIDARGGVLTSSFVALVPPRARRRAVAHRRPRRGRGDAASRNCGRRPHRRRSGRREGACRPRGGARAPRRPPGGARAGGPHAGGARSARHDGRRRRRAHAGWRRLHARPRRRLELDERHERDGGHLLQRRRRLDSPHRGTRRRRLSHARVVRSSRSSPRPSSPRVAPSSRASASATGSSACSRRSAPRWTPRNGVRGKWGRPACTSTSRSTTATSSSTAIASTAGR